MSRMSLRHGRWPVAVSLAAAALLLAACGGASSASGQGAGERRSPVASAAPVTPAAATPEALDFSGTTVVDGAAF